MVATMGTVRIKVEPEGMEALRLAAAAGRLFQAITTDTVRQMSEAELRAWAVFTSSLDGLGASGWAVKSAGEVSAEGALEPVRFSPGS